MVDSQSSTGCVPFALSSEPVNVPIEKNQAYAPFQHLKLRRVIRQFEFCCAFVASLVLGLAGSSISSRAEAQVGISLDQVQVTSPLRRSSLLRVTQAVFIENRGQFDPLVRFECKTPSGTLWVTNKGLVFDINSGASLDLPFSAGLQSEAGKKQVGINRFVFAADFVNANLSNINPSDPSPGVYNFISGNDAAKSKTNVRGYKQIVAHDIWPGIDLRLFINGNGVEQEFLVHAWADPNRIQISYRGAESLQVKQDGTIGLSTPAGELTESTPRVYQDVAGHRIPVAARFKLTGSLSYTFGINGYDRSQTLVIDPTLLFSTYLGGSGTDKGNGVAVDSSGNTYIVGTTTSPDFPSTMGGSGTAFDTVLFITKFNTGGTAAALGFSTIIHAPTGAPQTGYYGEAIAVDSSANIYVAGLTASQVPFPTTSNAFQPCTTDPNMFVAKFNPSGDSMLYSSCIGVGSSLYYIDTYYTQKLAIAADDMGHAYVVGSSQCGFTTTPNAFQQSCHTAPLPTDTDVVLSVFDTAAAGAASLLYSSYLGGSFSDLATGVAVDPTGNVYVTGTTRSHDFPTSPGVYQNTFPGSYCGFYTGVSIPCRHGFVTKINPRLSGSASLVYSTLVTSADDGFAEDIINSVAVDQLGAAYVTGYTTAKQFPVTSGAFQATNKSGVDYTGHNLGTAFVAQLIPSGSGLGYATYLGGGGQDTGNGIAVDKFTNIYVTGSTSSSDFPLKDAIQTTLAGKYDAFVTELNPQGSALVYSTYLGGTDDDQALGIAVDANGNASITGLTKSLNFPTRFPFQFGLKGSYNTFVVQVGPVGPTAGPVILRLWPSRGGNTGSATIAVAGSGFDAGATAFLTCPEGNPISASAVDVSADGTYATASFNLVGVSAQKCNVVFRNTDGSSYTLPSGFSVEQGGAADLWADLIGRKALRAGLDQTYYLLVGDRGTVDGQNAIVSMFIPQPLTSPASSAIILDQYPVRDGVVVSYVQPTVPSLNTSTSAIQIQAPDDPAFAHHPFTISGQIATGDALLTSAPRASVSDTLSASQAVRASAKSHPLASGSGVASVLNSLQSRLFGPALFDSCSEPINLCPVACSSEWDRYAGFRNVTENAQLASIASQKADIYEGLKVASEITRDVAVSLEISLVLDKVSEGLVAEGLTHTAAATFRAYTGTLVQLLYDAYKAGPDNPDGVHTAAAQAATAIGGFEASNTEIRNVRNIIKSRALQKEADDYLLYAGLITGAVTTLIDDSASLKDTWNARNVGRSGFLGAQSNMCTAVSVYQACSIAKCASSFAKPTSPYIDDFHFLLQTVTSGDPNDKVGVPGVGPSGYLSAAQQAVYSIYFDNQPTASAPAQIVSVADALNVKLTDMNTLVLGPITFLDKAITPPSTPLLLIAPYTTDVDLRPGTNLIVRVAVTINPATGLLKWTFTSIDPATNLPTTDPLAGLLPPGKEGSVSFSGSPTSLTTGTQVTNKATIVFDNNPPIDTPVWLNTIDADLPKSKVSPLSATQTTTGFVVQWSGSDVGSGIRDYTVYVSDNGAVFTPWQVQTSATEATYTGVSGHTYQFYSIARDQVGNVEASKAVAEASTQVVATGTDPLLALSVSAVTFTDQPIGFPIGQTVSLSNTGAGPLTITGVVLTGPNVSDFVQTNDCRISLAPGGSCSIVVVFQPTALGMRSATMLIASNATPSPQAVTALGSGAPDVIITAAVSSLTINRGGGPSSTALTLTPAPGFSGSAVLYCAVKFAGTGVAQDLPTCTATPNPTVVSSGTTASAMLVISTTAVRSSVLLKLVGAGIALALLLVLPIRPRRWSAVLVLLLAITVPVGCGIHPPKSTETGVAGTSLGNYAVTVTSTNGASVSATAVSVIVQ